MSHNIIFSPFDVEPSQRASRSIEPMSIVSTVLTGLSVGILSGVTLLYALQPKVIYPAWMIATFDHPWLFIPLLILAAYVASMNPALGALLALIIIALISDRVLFGSPLITMGSGAGASEAAGDAEDADAGGFGFGPPLHNVDIADLADASDLTYPLFNGLHDLQPGEPAPF